MVAGVLWTQTRGPRKSSPEGGKGASSLSSIKEVKDSGAEEEPYRSGEVTAAVEAQVLP